MRSLLYETVLEDIKAQLRSGVLGPGDRLPTIAAMARQTGVSQPSVREAYRVLESMGILEITQGRGTFVSAGFADPQETLRGFQLAERESLAHLFESRRILEPSIAAFAAARGTEAELDAIVATAKEMEQLHACGGDFLEPDVRFHELVVAAAHNPVMAKMLATVNELLLDSRRRTMRIAGADEKAVNYHLLIAMAIRDRDSDAARALMLQHVTDVEQDAMRRSPARGEAARADGQRETAMANDGQGRGGKQ